MFKKVGMLKTTGMINGAPLQTNRAPLKTQRRKLEAYLLALAQVGVSAATMLATHAAYAEDGHKPLMPGAIISTVKIFLANVIRALQVEINIPVVISSPFKRNRHQCFLKKG